MVPYVYVFDPSIRMMLFDWLSVSENDIINPEEFGGSAIELADVSNAKIINNTCINCTEIEVESYSFNNTVINNTISSTRFGIFLVNSTQNTISENNLVEVGSIQQWMVCMSLLIQ